MTPGTLLLLRRLVLAFFLLSGMTGLVYEVLWTRRLTLIFGHTVFAVSTVVTAFMAGLALGSLAGGRWCDRRRPGGAGLLASYGVLEIFIGLWALLSPLLLGWVEQAYVQAAAGGLSGWPLQGLCLAASIVTLVPATTAMGATLPILSRFLVGRREELGGLLAALYATNTLGAFTGASLAGFLLLPAAGLLTSLRGAAAISTLVGLAAAVMARRLGAGASPGADVSATPPDWSAPPATRRGLLPWVFALFGVASMAYQVGWTRGLVLTLGSSTYCFAAILAVFLGGLGLGSLLYPRLVRQRPPRLEHLGLLALALGLLGAATIPALGWLPWLLPRLFSQPPQSFWTVLGVDLGLCLVLLLGPTLLMGLAFPLGSQLHTRQLGSVGRDVADIYGANTLGCILGAALAGFLMIPLAGAQWTLKAAALLDLGLAALLFLTALPRGRRRLLAAGASLALGLAVALLPAWDPTWMSSGVGIYQLGKPVADLPPPLYYRDGVSCTVSLHLLPGPNMSLRVNGKSDASTFRPDMLTQRLAGFLPALLHPGPRSAAVVGFGSGVTLDSLRRVPGLNHIDSVELEPAVLEAGRYWKAYNHDVLSETRIRHWATDGRTFLLGSPRRYDLIISEPSNPWMAGIGNLFTRDFYQACAGRLEPGGLMAQHLQLYHVSRADLGMVLRSFFSAFPYGSMWVTAAGDSLLVGSLEPLRPPDVARRFAEMTAMQEQLWVLDVQAPEEIMGRYLLDRSEALAAFPEGPSNTDDRPLLEFSAPLSLYRPNLQVENYRYLRRYARRRLAPWMEDGERSLSLAAPAWDDGGDEEGALEFLQARAATLPEAALNYARLLARHGSEEGARRAFEAARRAGADPGRTAASWARFEAGAGHPERAAALYRQALASPPPGSLPQLWLGLGQALTRAGRFAEALPALQKAAELDPWGGALTRTGVVLYEMGRLDEALETFRQAAALDPVDAEARVGQGNVWLRRGRYPEAMQAYRAALALEPFNGPALLNLGACQVQMGDLGGAALTYRRLLHYFPNHQVARRNLELLSQ
jgi:spermidine synthase